MARKCAGINEHGVRCRQAPLLESKYCFWHDPGHKKEAAEARRLGGLNRRRERRVQATYDVDGLATSDQIRRVLEVALMSELRLTDSHNRSRVLIAVAAAAARLLETSDLEIRLSTLENALSGGKRRT